MQQIIALVVQHPEAAADVRLPGDISRTDLPGLPLLRDLLETLETTPKLSTAALVERAESPETRSALAKLAAARLELLPGVDVRQQLADALERLAGQVRKAELAALSSQPLETLSELEKQRLRELSRRPATAQAEDGGLEKPAQPS
jgi:DNA primase